MAIAIDSGKATIATVSLAITSALNASMPWPSRKTVISFGVYSAVKLGSDTVEAVAISRLCNVFVRLNPAAANGQFMI
jgi:hypothetical protein